MAYRGILLSFVGVQRCQWDPVRSISKWVYHKQQTQLNQRFICFAFGRCCCCLLALSISISFSKPPECVVWTKRERESEWVSESRVEPPQSLVVTQTRFRSSSANLSTLISIYYDCSYRCLCVIYFSTFHCCLFFVSALSSAIYCHLGQIKHKSKPR